MSKMMSKKAILEVLEERGIDRATFKEELATVNETVGDFASDELKYAMVARVLGVETELLGIPKNIKSSGGPSVEVEISEIEKLIEESEQVPNLQVAGYILSEEDGLTRTGNPKKRLTITDGIGSAVATVFDECLSRYIEIGTKVHDRVEFEGASIFQYEDKGGNSRFTVNCGRFTEITILRDGKTLKELLTDFPEAEKDKVCVASGIVMDTSVITYEGCPICMRSCKDSDDLICDCAENNDDPDVIVEPTTLSIVHAGITDGADTNVDVTIFPRLNIAQESIAFKPVTVVGTKVSDNEMNCMSIKVEGESIAIPHDDLFEKPKKSKQKGSSKDVKYNSFLEMATELMDFYEDGIAKREFISVLTKKTKGADTTEIKAYLNRMIKDGKVEMEGSMVVDVTN